MSELNIKLSPKGILNKNFNVNTNGYNPKEVDEYLDEIIEDYTMFFRFKKDQEREAQELIEENNRLKNEIRKIKLDLETLKEEDGSGKFSSNNVDLLKRLSNLEKIVYGKNE